MKLLHNNETAHYIENKDNTVNKTNNEAKAITNAIEIDDRVEVMLRKHIFLSIKDLKEGFRDNTKCRLINPAKSQILE